MLIAPSGVAHADPVPPPPYVDHTRWVHWADMS
ncbi:MAG: hypothetical protein JWR37_4097, partial [Mycobacterium sp.]|nr:hypothetical protein [Mycobacterium sp.]